MLGLVAVASAVQVANNMTNNTAIVTILVLDVKWYVTRESVVKMVQTLARVLVYTSFVYLTSSRLLVASELSPDVFQAVQAACLSIETALSEDRASFEVNSTHLFFEVRQACAPVLKLTMIQQKVRWDTYDVKSYK